MFTCQTLNPETWYLALDSLVFGIWPLVFGIWDLAAGTSGTMQKKVHLKLSFSITSAWYILYIVNLRLPSDYTSHTACMTRLTGSRYGTPRTERACREATSCVRFCSRSGFLSSDGLVCICKNLISKSPKHVTHGHSWFYQTPPDTYEFIRLLLVVLAGTRTAKRLLVLQHAFRQPNDWPVFE